MKIFFSFFLSIFVCFSCQSQTQKIELKLTKGQSYTQKTVAKSVIKQKVNDQEISINMTITGQMKYLVTDYASGIYSMDVSYENLSMKMVHPGGTSVFDSESTDETDIMSSVFRMMKNKPFQIKMTQSGKIAEVKNVEVLYAGAFDKFPQLTAEQKEQIRTQIMQSYGDKAFKGNLEMLSAVFPDRAVAKGDTWNIKTQLEAGMSATLDGVYKLDEITATEFVISGASLFTTKNNEADTATTVLPFEYNMAGTMNSVMRIDKKTGWLIEGKISQNIRGTMSIKASEKMPEGMTVPMEMTSDMVFTDK
ncbi:DUF6263 family protein [Pedobacter foliorum]|uniref:DUF6263 family protein n=1 Tax=Pedobacter foliorum TaxID=2739058 RepID=UPI001564362D|nr:DUF6263 family protein [Pedobacter foliorum]NRF41342.1 hypothetical protein [Pedobacter foliorum]